MKRLLLAAAAALAVMSASAQDKLNFEAPLFGVTKKNVKPQWSLVAFGEVGAGYGYRMNLPSQIHQNGVFAELDLLEMRYRPGRNANLLSMGLSVSLDANVATKTTFFGMSGQFTTPESGWMSARALAAERVFSLDFGYTREFGDWRAGLFLSPGVGHGILQNRYWVGEDSNTGFVGACRHRDNLHMHSGLRFGVSAGIWYRSVGLTAGWHYRSILPGNQNVIHAGLSIRY